MNQSESGSRPSYLNIGLLILAGEAAFLLPFVLPRIFRPTVIAVFGIDNLELGSCFSAYGTVALLSYFFGGPLADRFPPRKLMAWALWTTALGGVALSTYPPLLVLTGIYAYWGFTTIFLFWAAMLKATRQWGGATKQGRAFGMLDGGRGLVSALMGTAGVALFAVTIGDVDQEIPLEQQQHAFRLVILFTSALVAGIGGAVWIWLEVPDTESAEHVDEHKKFSLSSIVLALRMPSVWLLMLIVLCGYVGYKATDDFSLYAKDVMLMNDFNSAKVGTLLLYIRPLVGVAAGCLADWTRAATWLIVGFLLMLLGAVLIGSGVIAAEGYGLFAVALIASSVGVFSIRSLYFAAMQEGRIPLHITGTAVGLISVVGYTPDIFMGPLMGYFLEGWEGETGHQYLFWMLAGFSVVGAGGAIWFRLLERGADENPPAGPRR